MSRFRSRWITAPVLFAFAAASCSDLPTASTVTAPQVPVSDAAAGRPAWAADVGGAPHICFTSVRTPQGPHRYRYGRVRLHFPASALALDGATTLYRYRVQGPGEDPVVVANCRIPRTVEAVEIMDRRLRVADRRRWRPRDEQADGTSTIQSCPSSGCILEPIYVSPYYPGGWGGGGGGGWDDGCGLNASVGDCWEDNGGGDDPTDDPYEDTPTGEPVADDEWYYCVDLGCNLREPTAAERLRVQELVNRIRSDGFCGEIRASAQAMIDRHLRVWENEVYTANDQGKQATLLGEAPWIPEIRGHGMYLWTHSLNAWTVAHEGLHGIWTTAGLGHYYTHRDVTPLGMGMDATAKYCSGS